MYKNTTQQKFYTLYADLKIIFEYLITGWKTDLMKDSYFTFGKDILVL